MLLIFIFLFSSVFPSFSWAAQTQRNYSPKESSIKAESVTEVVYGPKSETVGSDVFLHGNYIEVGVSGSGSFGTDNAAPAGFHPSPTYYGMLGFRADKDGFDRGEEPQTGDFFLPGDPEEGFTVGYKEFSPEYSEDDPEDEYEPTILPLTEEVDEEIDDEETSDDERFIIRNFTNVERNYVVEIPSETIDTSRGSTLSATTEGTTENGKLKVKQIVSFGVNDKFFKNTVTITNKTVSETVYDVRYMRNFDPDQDRDFLGEYDTLNTVMENPPQDKRALVRAIGPESGESVFLVSFDQRSRASSFGFNNDNVFDEESYAEDGSSLLKDEFRDDMAIALNTALGDLEPGESASFTYYTSLNADFETGMDEIEHEIFLSADSVTEHCPDETVVGKLSTSASSEEGLHTFSLGDDSVGIFSIDGDSLIVSNGSLIDYNTASLLSVTVKLTCSKTEKSYYKTFDITVLPLPSQPLHPVLEGVDYNESKDTYIAHWGWKNENTYTVSVPASDSNKFTGDIISSKDYPMTDFVAGRVYNAFTTEFDGSNLVWTLKGPDGKTRTSTASKDSKPFDVSFFQPLHPVLEGIVWNVEDSVYTAHWGWKNENSFPVTVPNIHSKFTGNPISGKTTPPNIFDTGRIVDAFTTVFDGSNLVWTLRGPNGETRTATASKDSKRLTELVLDATDYELYVGDKKQISVTAKFSDESQSDVTDEAQFLSLEPELFTVDDYGVIEGLTKGTNKVQVTYWGLTTEATVNVIVHSNGGGGGSSNTPPPVTNLASGTIIDRMPGYISLTAPVWLDGLNSTAFLKYDIKKLKDGITPRAYYWNSKVGKWVALATYPAGEGKVKLVNDGNYKGWVTVFGVIQPEFTDLQGHWAENIINRMNGLGIVEGYKQQNSSDSLRLFVSDKSVTRTEFAVFLYRLLNINPSKTKVTALSRDESASILQSNYSDTQAIPEWAGTMIGSLTKAGIIQGKGGKFEPATPITRAEASVMASKALGILGIDKSADLTWFTDSEEIPKWAETAISSNILDGYPDGSLKPNSYISRAEATTILYNLFVKGMNW